MNILYNDCERDVSYFIFTILYLTREKNVVFHIN